MGERTEAERESARAARERSRLDREQSRSARQPSQAVREPRRRLHVPHPHRPAASARSRVVAIASLIAVAVLAALAVLLARHLAGSGRPLAAAPTVKVLIPEGETRLQIAAIARKDGLRGNYMEATRHVPGFPLARYGAPAHTPNLEGFLFPATYDAYAHGSVQALISDQLEAFHERFTSSLAQRAHALGLTPYQMLIVASMIEREAKLPQDRALVAAVIYNRLQRKMPLGVDATIRFALNDYTKPLTEAQLHTPSPYNTRLHKGLPPTPISNPGMESIEAAAAPAHVGYLYYVDGPDGCGDLVFSNTEAEFEASAARYHEALAANGGHLPACKHR